LYNLSVGLVSGDPNSLEATYALKTPTQLGLTANQTSAFDPILDALRLDDDASAAFAALSNAEDFFDAYEDLLPSYSSAAAEIATTAIRQGQAASSNRLASTRLHGLDEVSIWAQEIGYGVTRTPPTANGQEYDGNGFGVAFGIDGPLENGALFGLSGAFVASEVTEEGRPEGGEISAWFAQANVYLGAGLGPVDLDIIGGFGGGKLRSRRFVEIGDSFDAFTEADWWAFEGHGSVRVSAPMSVSNWFTMTPQAALTYVALSESSYTESGGGAAIDYDVDSAFSQRLWADAGVEFSARFQGRGQGAITPRMFLGYRANVIDDEAERTVRFASGGSDFTLIDDPVGDGGALVGIGFDATNGYSTFSLGYEGEFSDQIDRHSVNAAVRFRF
jgi:outer membrane autotransporter protein